MFFLALIVLGIVSFQRLAVNLLPNLSFPRVLVWTTFSGVGPTEMEEFVTMPIERAIATVPGVREITSVSREAISLVTVEFAWGRNMDFASLSLREKLDNLRYELPNGVDRSVILRGDPNSQPIMTMAIADSSNIYSIYTLARDVFKRRFEQIDGVALATVTGGLQRQIQIDVDMKKASAVGLALEAIEDGLKAANVTRTGGSVKKGRYRYSLRTLGEFQSTADIAETHINVSTGTKGDFIDVRLGDIATIHDGFEEQKGTTRLNGREAIGILITKEADANTVETSTAIHKVNAELRQQYPDVKVDVIDDQAAFISSAIAQVKQALIWGGVLAFVVLFFFLHDFQNPINIAVAMPVSVIITFVLMYFSGLTLNLISLGGLALGVGMLVDNSIVVLENIFRHRQEGMPHSRACIEGTREVTTAITASTFTTIAVFFPILYIEGIAGQLFREQSLTVSFSLLASLLVAISLLPMLAARWRHKSNSDEVEQLKTKKNSDSGVLAFVRVLPQKFAGHIAGLFSFWLKSIGRLLSWFTAPIFQMFEKTFTRFAIGYEHRLVKAIDAPQNVVRATLIIFAVSMLASSLLDRRLMPEVEQRKFNVILDLPSGTTLQTTTEMADDIEAIMSESAAVSSVFTQVGIIEGDRRNVQGKTGANYARLEVHLRAGEQTAQTMRELHPKLQAVAGNAASLQKPQTAIAEILGTAKTDLVVNVRGADPDTAAMLLAEITPLVQKIDGVSRLFRSDDEKRPAIKLTIDRQKAAVFNVSISRIAHFIERFMRGKIATDFRDFNNKIPILLRADVGNQESINRLMEASIQVDGTAIPVSQLVEANDEFLPAHIGRQNQVRQSSVYVTVKNGYYNQVATAIEEMISQRRMPYGFEIELGGQRREMLSSFREMAFAFILAFVLVFMILAAQFESLRHPFIIILAVPLSLTGVIWGLLITGQEFNVMSLIGTVVLVGIVVNDAIIKVDFINSEKKRGLPLRQAILMAGQKRLRPIIMTTMTTVLGLLPMAVGLGDGAELRRPLAIAVIFGLTVATLTSLFVVPVIYLLIETKRGRQNEIAPELQHVE